MQKFLLTLALIITLSSCTKAPQVCEVTHSHADMSAKFADMSLDDLDKQERRLVAKAATAMETAYNPYSHFFVGAALLHPDGSMTAASNVENASYGGTICAERSALLKANSMKKRNVVKIAIIGRGKDFDTEEVVTPCGLCRQVIYEFSQISNIDIKIIMANSKQTKIKTAYISELLPLAFGPKDVGVDLNSYSK